MKIFRQSLRSKLIGVFLVPTLLIVGLYGFLAYFAGRQGLEDELGERLVSVGQTLSAQWSDGFDAKQIERLDETKVRVVARLTEELRKTCERTGVRRAYLFTSDHTSLADSDESVQFGAKLYELEPHRGEIERVFALGEPATSVLFKGPDELLYKTGFAPISNDGHVIAAVGIEASASFFDLLNNFATVLTVLAVLGVLLIVLAATIFSRRLVAPINTLVEAAGRLGRGELDAPVVAGAGGDEIDFLSTAFEEMRRDIVSRDRQMQMMLSGIAHEVRNPLGGMELFCGLLREDLEAGEIGTVEGEMLEKVAKIQRELEYLGHVVNDFLDFARNVPVALQRFDARDFVAEVDDLLRGDVVDAGCTLDVVVDGDDVEITADRQRLRRALINIVRNAVQACGEGGEIRVEVRASGNTRIVEVHDDGPGIAEEQLAEVLTPFFTTKEKGSGLGLALTQRILEQHFGELEIESEVDQGTSVRFLLPFDDTIEAESGAIPEGWLG